MRAHNPEVAGSSPAAATKSGCFREKTATFFAFLLENDLGQRNISHQKLTESTPDMVSAAQKLGGAISKMTIFVVPHY